MNDDAPDFDLKLMPDWLKETPGKNPYANYETRESDRPRRDFGSDRSRSPRQGPPRGEGRSPRGEGRPQRSGDSQQRGPKGPHGQRRDHPPGESRPPQQAPRVEMAPAAVSVEFIPEPNCVASIARQIKAGGRACPLFGLAKMFLARPERHRVRITSTAPGVPLIQCGEEGPVSLDRSILERNAFTTFKDRFYSEETIQREPIKGNYTNVARCRLSGKLLGPTNYHAYQPALRKLYEAQFSRRMSFQEYLREIETSTRPEEIEAWKEQARSVTTYKALDTPEPVVFDSIVQVEQHFRKNHLESLFRTGNSFEISGDLSRSLPDRRIAAAVKQAWEKEIGFPGQLMHHLRRTLCETGLHLFKHRKRMQFISSIRPDRFNQSQQALSGNIALILQTIEATPKCTRADLAHKIFESKQDDPELPKMKAALAADLHWLIHAGHVIEFQDGKLDLPLSPKQAENEDAREKPAAQPAAARTPSRPAKAPVVAPTPVSDSLSNVPEENVQAASEPAPEPILPEEPPQGAVPEPISETAPPEGESAANDPVPPA